MWNNTNAGVQQSVVVPIKQDVVMNGENKVKSVIYGKRVNMN